MTRDAFEKTGPLGRIVLSARALASVVARSAESVEGVQVRRSRRQPAVEVGEHVQIVLAVSTRLGAPLPETGELVQRAVAAAVGATTGQPVRVDVTIEAVSA